MLAIHTFCLFLVSVYTGLRTDSPCCAGCPAAATESGKFDLATWETRVMMRYQQFYKKKMCVTRDADGAFTLYGRHYARKVCSDRCNCCSSSRLIDKFCGLDFEQIPRIKSVIVICYMFLEMGATT